VICLLAGRPAVGSDALGPEVLFESLAAAVLARFRHPSWALVAGLGIGVAVQVVGYNWPGGMSDVVLFVVVAVGAVLVWRPWSARDGRRDDRRPWLAVPVLPARRAGSLLGRGVVLGAALLAVAAGLGAGLASNSQALTLTEIAAYATLAISVTLMVGVAGQLTLGQVALFGVGAAVSYQLAVAANLPFWLAFLGAGVAAAAAAVVVGLPALQGPGPVFAVTSLGFALVAAGWLLTRSWLIGAGVTIPRPILGPIDLGPQRPYLVFSVVVLAAALAVVQVLLRRGPGRRMVAVRDNEAAAASFGIPAAATTLLAFAVAGFLAGIAGAVYGHGLQAVSVNDFPVASPGLQIGAVDSLRIVAIAVIGGLGSPAGAIAGAALVVGADELTHSVALRLATSGAGLVVVLMLAPRGLAGIWGSPGWARRSWHGVRGRLAAGRAGRRAAQ
jgi:ABC-type branched-subunit amino acid transport system permease subunit